MVTAYILIQTEVGKAAQVAKEIAEIKGVQQAEDQHRGPDEAGYDLGQQPASLDPVEEPPLPSRHVAPWSGKASIPALALS